MSTINQFASITNSMARISGSIGDLAYQFKEVAPRTALDDANIDVYAARELRRVSNSIIRLDYRVGDLERMFAAERFREPERRDRHSSRDEESGSDGPS